MTLRCPVSRCAATNPMDAAACAHCGTPLREYTRMTAHPANLFNDGLAAAHAGRLTEARDLFAALVHWCPEAVDARNALGLACYQLGDTAHARTHWTAVLDRRPTDRVATAGLRALTDPSNPRRTP